MASGEELVKAVRSGSLRAVRAMLEAGAPVEGDAGAPGMPLGIACFMGFADIVRELAGRGARINLPDNAAPVSPLSMAIRGKRVEVVRLLIELGAEVPPGLETGLSDLEVIAAQWQAYREGRRSAPPADASGEIQEVEEIVMPKALGTDTMVLEADMVKAALEREAQRKAKK